MHMIREILKFYEGVKEVKAIALGGSVGAATSDENSDIDIYVFVEKDIPIESRLNFVKAISSKYEVGGEYFGSGDEFFVDKLGKQLDVMYFNVNWFEGVIDNVWFKHYPSNGYTTCFLYTLDKCEIFYDPKNWLSGFKNKIKTPYPEELKKNIINRNINLMKDKPFASYYEQIEKALSRGDRVSVNHRISAFLASYFDVIFANNELLHPGEKRLVKFARDNCRILPKDFEENLNLLLNQPNSDTLLILDGMVSNLKAVLN